MAGLARTLLVAGVVFVVAGVLLLLAARLRLPLGHWPGDIVVRRGKATIYFPWVTMLVVSVIASLIFSFFRR